MEKENRTIQLHFYVTEKENKRIKQGMSKTGIISLSAYLRQMALNDYFIHLDLSDIKNMTRTISTCSNNLNQYARKAYETRSIYAADIEDLSERYNEIFDMGKTIILQLSELIGNPPPLHNRRTKRIKQ